VFKDKVQTMNPFNSPVNVVVANVTFSGAVIDTI